METFDQILFTVRGIKEFDHVQKLLSATINEKLQVRKTNKNWEENMDISNIALISDSGISAGFGEIDLIDISIEHSNLLL